MYSNKSKFCALLPTLLIGALCVAVRAVDGINYRLDGSVVPSYYNITIRPYLLESDKDRRFTFDGDVSILLQTAQSNLREITLHKDYIDIEGCWLYNVNGVLLETIDSSTLLYEQATDKLTVPLAQPLDGNVTYKLRFRYTGQIRNGMAGLFRVSYVEAETGQTKWMAVTQLQRIDARVLFPCFDEPAMKAKFELHISRPIDYTVITNTKLLASTADAEVSDRIVDQFDVTPLMSTYLVAFIVCEYKARGDGAFRVISRPDYYNYTEFSYQVGERTLQAYSELFQHPYSELGNELLQFASSPIFPHNGMENWGLIIYRDDVLVRLPDYTDGWVDKEYSVRIIAHETSHMWFGDSVTFAWWSYFWLNEGFARYYEFFLAHQLYPEYQLDQQFVVRQLRLAMNMDADATAQPLTSEASSINSPAEIAYKFSGITYAKGASIVRMWRNAMGHDNFDAAISAYLKEHHLGNTEPKHLFEHLKEHWSAPASLILDTFFSDYTEQVGLPMLMVNVSQDFQRINMEQQRFLFDAQDGSNRDLRYTVPITYTTSRSPDFRNLTPVAYFDKISGTFTRFFLKPIDWVVVNLQASNYQRVLYDTPLLNRLQLALSQQQHSGIVVENRAQIIDDLFSFARAGMIDYVTVFEFTEYMSYELEYTPWYAMYYCLRRIAPRLTVEQLPDFATYLKDITKLVYERLGVTDNAATDTVLDVYNRELQLSWLCKYQHEGCNRDVLKTLTLYRQSGKKPSVDYRETFYCAASRAGEYAIVLDYYKQETHAGDKQKLWNAASCTKNYQLHYDNEILGGDSSKAMKVSGLAQLYQQNPENVTPVFKMLTRNITQLAEALDSWEDTAEALAELANYFTTPAQQQLLEEFIKQDGALFGSHLKTLEAAVETVRSNLAWSDQRLGRLVQYLGQRNAGAATQLLRAALLLLPLLSGLLQL